MKDLTALEYNEYILAWNSLVFIRKEKPKEFQNYIKDLCTGDKHSMLREHIFHATDAVLFLKHKNRNYNVSEKEHLDTVLMMREILDANADALNTDIFCLQDIELEYLNMKPETLN